MMQKSIRRPEELQALAAQHGIAATLHPTEQPMLTVEEAAEALGISTDAMTKNIVFLVEGRPLLAIARGETQVDRRVLARQYGVGRKKIKLATPEQTYEVTGFVAGCVPSFGHKQTLPTYIDSDVLALERVYGGSGEPNCLVSLPPGDLVRLTEGQVLSLSKG